MAQQVERTIIDEIPVYYAPVPGPLMAAISFRVGQADETIATHGLTHLVEHLALTMFDPHSLQFNGAVAFNRCTFYVRGDRVEVLDFIESVCSRVRDLPVDRIEVESKILEAEDRRRGPSTATLALMARYGARSYGLPWFREYGLGRSDIASLVPEWSRHFFTKQNCSVWISGDPDGIRISLGDGHRVQSPDLFTLPKDLPAAATDPIPGAVLSFESERSVGLVMALDVLGRRLRDRLRHREGITYDIAVDYLPVSGDRTHMFVGVDSAPEKSIDAATAMLEEVEQLIDGGATPDEMETYVRRARIGFEDELAIPTRLDQAVTNELLGAPNPTVAELLEQMESATSSEVRQALTQATESMLLITPEPPKGSTIELARYESKTAAWVNGKSYSLRNMFRSLSGPTIIVNNDAIGLRAPDGSATVIVFENCLAAFRFPSGRRLLWAFDGGAIPIAPRHWAKGKQLLKFVDERTEGVAVAMREDSISEQEMDVRKIKHPGAEMQWRRLAAFVIDALPLIPALVDGFRDIGSTSGWAVWPGESLSIVLVVGWVAYQAIGVSIWGRTLGKAMLGITVVDQRSQSKPNVLWATVRAIVLLATLFALAGLAVSVMMLQRVDGRTLHDLAGRTVVLKTSVLRSRRLS